MIYLLREYLIVVGISDPNKTRLPRTTYKRVDPIDVYIRKQQKQKPNEHKLPISRLFFHGKNTKKTLNELSFIIQQIIC